MTNVRLASPADRDNVLHLVGKLLAELGGTPPSPADMTPAYDRLIDGEGNGFIAVGGNEGALVAVCTVSFLQALRTRGRYAIIQEMYVQPDFRSTGVGGEVLRLALEQSVAKGCGTVELGTPYHGERQIEFYRRAGFTEVGARLRWRK